MMNKVEDPNTFLDSDHEDYLVPHLHVIDNESDVDLWVEGRFNKYHSNREPTLALSVSGEGEFGRDILGIALSRDMVKELVEVLQDALKSATIDLTALDEDYDDTHNTSPA